MCEVAAWSEQARAHNRANGGREQDEAERATARPWAPDLGGGIARQENLTMAAVADRAGVTRRAVYVHFASRAELVAGLFDHVAESEGLEASLRRVWDAPDAVAALDEWAQHLARYHTRLLAVDRAVERVRRADEDAARHRDRVVKAKLGSCRRLARRIDEEGRLTPPWTAATAADMLFALTSSDVVEGLTVDRDWSAQKLADHLAILLRSTFVKPTTEGKG